MFLRTCIAGFLLGLLLQLVLVQVRLLLLLLLLGIELVRSGLELVQLLGDVRFDVFVVLLLKVHLLLLKGRVPHLLPFALRNRSFCLHLFLR